MKVCKECGTCLEDSSPITAEWLREVWGADLSLYRIGNINGSFYIDSDGSLVWKHVGNETARLTTRQQFCDLARCLGIPRRPSKSEPGCTCLDSPNMLYAPCSYCEQRRKDGAK